MPSLPLPLPLSENPVDRLPESALLGPASQFLESLDTLTRHRVGVTVLRLLAHLRTAHVGDASLLTSFTLLEMSLNASMQHVTAPVKPTQVYGPPPTLTPTE